MLLLIVGRLKLSRAELNWTYRYAAELIADEYRYLERFN